MKKLYGNFTITVLLMLVVALFDYVIIPLPFFSGLGVGLIITFVYFAGWVLLKQQKKL
jgi:hypothetical protein